MILERDAELKLLDALLSGLESARGRVVLVRGEAGIGKTALMSELVAELGDRVHVLLGTCDDLLTPQPLGPIWDIGRHDSSVSVPLAQGDRRAVMETLLDLLSRKLRPTVLVFEDTQWADEATLDVIKFLGRRIAQTNGILVLTLRDGEVDADHPLRQVIGDLPPQCLVRMNLDRLSPQAVASMVEGTDLNLEETLSLTGGNPLFVTEVVASGVEAVPSSIRDSVLARASKVSPDARLALDLISVIPGETWLSLVEDVLGTPRRCLTECVRQGLLRIDAQTVAFSHELQRRAIESSLSPTNRRGLNAQVLANLSREGDSSRLVHHAREAEDVEAIITHAPSAAREATAIKSTREAVAHFRLLKPYLHLLPVDEQANILEDWAREEYYLNNAASLELLDRAIVARRSLGDARALARTITTAVRIRRSHLRSDEALADAIEAVELLEPFGPSADLAKALSLQAFMNWLTYEDVAGALVIADKATAVAESADDGIATIWSLNTKGSIRHSGGEPHAISLVEQSLRLAEIGGHAFEEVRTLMDLAAMCGDERNIERAIDFARRAQDAAVRNEMPVFEAEAKSMYSEFQLWKGAWGDAEDKASECLESSPVAAVLVWRVLATLQMRRGRTKARASLDRMLDLSATDKQLTVMDPAAAVLAEYMWLSGEEDLAWSEMLGRILRVGLDAGHPWPSGAFAFWMWKLGLLDTSPPGTANFYGWIIRGDYRKAAEFWKTRRVPYEQALALMHGGEAEQIEAIRIFEKLGATATSRKVRQALLSKGVKVPRGESHATRNSIAGLTARQSEVLDLLSEGLANADIAERLFVSHRTVENHVAAILMKLDVSTRTAAVSVAVDRGIIAPR